VTVLLATKAAGITGLQKAGAIAAIVGASVALILFLTNLARWWWRNHRLRSLKVRIFDSGEEKYLGIVGLPVATAQVTAFVNDSKETKKLGPAAYRRDIQAEHLFSLRFGQPGLDESAEKYKVELFTLSDLGDRRRVFKGKVRKTARDAEDS
jgi:hypothetical protein